MGAYLWLVNAFVVLVLVGYLLLKNPELFTLLSERQQLEPLASTIDSADEDGIPDYSYSTHKLVHPGRTTEFPFPSPRVRSRTAVPTILRPVDAISATTTRFKSEPPQDSHTSERARGGPPSVQAGVGEDNRPSTRSKSMPVQDTPRDDSTGRDKGKARMQVADDEEINAELASFLDSDESSEDLALASISKRSRGTRAGSARSAQPSGRGPSSPVLLRRNVALDKFRVETCWFASQSEHAISEPPKELAEHPELRVGDLFVHRSPQKWQLWMWDTKENSTQQYWNTIPLGYKRADNRRVIIQPQRNHPSWVSDQWGTRVLKDIEKKRVKI